MAIHQVGGVFVEGADLLVKIGGAEINFLSAFDHAFGGFSGRAYVEYHYTIFGHFGFEFTYRQILKTLFLGALRLTGSCHNGN